MRVPSYLRVGRETETSSLSVLPAIHVCFFYLVYLVYFKVYLLLSNLEAFT